MPQQKNQGWHIQGTPLHEMTMLYLRNHRELLAGTPEESVKNYLEIYMRMSRVRATIDPETLSCM